MSKWILGVLIVALAGIVPAAAEEAPAAVRVYNWTEYIDVDEAAPEDAPMSARSPTLRKFGEQAGAPVVYDEFESEEEMTKKLMNFPGLMDVVVMPFPNVQLMHQAGKLVAMNNETVPNRTLIDPRYFATGGDTTNFYVPYLSGATMLVYRRDLVGKDVTSWQDYFEPSETLKGKVHMLDSASSMFACALKYKQQDLSFSSDDVTKEAGRAMHQLKKNGYIGLISSDIEEIQAKLLSGEIAMAVLYCGDAITAANADPAGQIQYVVPAEGTEVVFDCLVVMRDAPHKDLALQFVNFMLDPAIQAANAVSLMYTCPNTAALAILQRDHPEIMANAALYPPPAAAAHMEAPAAVSPEAERLWEIIRQ